MNIDVKGAAIYAYTGGRAHVRGQPTVVFIHGGLNDHSVWILQSRYLAHHGFNVLALDLPGHCRSGGEAPASVEEAADVIAATCRNDTGCDGAAKAERIANGHHPIADFFIIRIAEFHRHKRLIRFDTQHREIDFRILANQFRF